MKPFDDYPGGGCTILKPMSRTNTRRGDGSWLMENVGQERMHGRRMSLPQGEDSAEIAPSVDWGRTHRR